MGSVRAKSLALFMLNFQNNFQSINEDEVEGYKMYSLFSQIEGKTKEDLNVSENTILKIERYLSTDNLTKRTKDLSLWLNSNENRTKYFISQNMQFQYQEYFYKENMLVVRKELIKKEEKNFVENELNLIYEEADYILV